MPCESVQIVRGASSVRAVAVVVARVPAARVGVAVGVRAVRQHAPFRRVVAEEAELGAERERAGFGRDRRPARRASRSPSPVGARSSPGCRSSPAGRARARPGSRPWWSASWLVKATGRDLRLGEAAYERLAARTASRTSRRSAAAAARPDRAAARRRRARASAPARRDDRDRAQHELRRARCRACRQNSSRSPAAMPVAAVGEVDAADFDRVDRRHRPASAGSRRNRSVLADPRVRSSGAGREAAARPEQRERLARRAPSSSVTSMIAMSAGRVWRGRSAFHSARATSSALVSKTCGSLPCGGTLCTGVPARERAHAGRARRVLDGEAEVDAGGDAGLRARSRSRAPARAPSAARSRCAGSLRWRCAPGRRSARRRRRPQASSSATVGIVAAARRAAARAAAAIGLARVGARQRQALQHARVEARLRVDAVAQRRQARIVAHRRGLGQALRSSRRCRASERRSIAHAPPPRRTRSRPFSGAFGSLSSRAISSRADRDAAARDLAGGVAAEALEAHRRRRTRRPAPPSPRRSARSGRPAGRSVKRSGWKKPRRRRRQAPALNTSSRRRSTSAAK